MLYYLYLLLLAPIYSLVSILLLRDQEREILLLRQQLLILHRQLSRKPAYGRLEKLALLLAALRLSKRRLATALLIVQPDTLLRWHRELVRRHWTFRQKRRPGRPPVTEEIQDLILRLARENPHWGCRKIQGETLKLGLKVSRSTVVRLLRRHALGPPPDNRRSPSWSQFLGQYKDFIWAADFFTVTTARLRTFYVLFFMELRRWRLMLFNVTEHPHAEWVVQQLRNLFVQHDHLPRFILHDRDGKFSEEFDAFAQASGTKIIKLPARSPNLNAYAERWVRSVRGECLDQIIVLSERHLRYVLKEYVEYFMKRRPHQGLKQQLPDSTEESPATGRVRCRQVLGGLINDYYREAA
jgi:transposase InsO family protein